MIVLASISALAGGYAIAALASVSPLVAASVGLIAAGIAIAASPKQVEVEVEVWNGKSWQRA